ncbi:DUF3800 domain-containing protein [Legionella bononiensis]|uniref:DUF3800 domain-containing protein n=1 Tax=Legionella bononiensis TaxID=2793102 RepID=A0ABS1W8S5_9GAMM|nr:DUF3800 domain-containing protein [Legionella bononiensis]MBL7479721.1 DUF3800 domain-containing protein [Legionella bononiensis]MBL7525766.1 DUF3800 domain-containing protein [Legionella bononiensis]MBL7561948.1 DUF3800 domain-containing protein [Legionella bononiensis]
MYCYIDESGNTGNHIFDPAQPVQYYGLLISPVNLNESIFEQIQNMRDKLNVSHLHARILGDRLDTISDELANLISIFALNFKVHTVDKVDYIIFQFFDIVFDNDVNPMVPLMWYNSPFRYKLLVAITYFIFNSEIKQLVWKAFSSKNEQSANTAFIETCKKIRNKLHKLPFTSSIRCRVFLILKWAIENYSQISFRIGLKTAYHVNIMCFRSVLDSIRETGVQPTEIVIDKESNYNVPQQEVLDVYRDLKNYSFPYYPHMPHVEFNNIPEVNFKFSSSRNNFGLEITDIYLWICKRKLEGRKLCKKFEELTDSSSFSWTNDISLNTIIKTWLLPNKQR